MQSVTEIDRRADELRKRFEERGLAMIRHDDEDDEGGHAAIYEAVASIGTEIEALSGSSEPVVHAIVCVAFLWSKIGGGGDRAVSKCIDTLARDLCGPFKAQVDALFERKVPRDKWA